jgi:cytochrome c oxidase subunit 3
MSYVESHSHDTAGQPPDEPLERFTARLGMWVFIGSEVLFFGGLLFAYGLSRAAHPAGFAAASRHTDVVLGTLNTALLLTSSAAVALAADWAGEKRWQAARRALMSAIGLGLIFLVIKGIEYAKEWQENLFPGPHFQLDAAAPAPAGAELFFMLYFSMTALHALHLLIGMGVLAWQVWQIWRPGQRPQGRIPPERASQVEMSALYWHFVDVVWILLYPLIYLIERHTT